MILLSYIWNKLTIIIVEHPTMAVQSAVQVCIICLDTDSNLYLLSEYNLEEAYEKVTGLSLSDGVKLAPTLCTECAYRLTKCYSFRKKSLRAHTLLMELFKECESLSIHNVKTVSRESNQLTSSLVKKVYEPDYCDSYIIDYEEDITELKLDTKSIYKVELKFEKADDITPVVKPVNETFINYVNNKEKLKPDSVEYFNDDIDFDDDIDCNVDYSNDIKQKDELHSRLDNAYNVEIVNDYNSDIEIFEDNVKNKQRINVPSKTNMPLNNPKQKKNIQNRVRKKTEKSNKKPATKTKSQQRNKFQNRLRHPEVSDKKPVSRINLKLFKVSTLTYEQQLAEVQQRQESKNYKTSKFKCTLCFKGFISKNAHSRHMIRHTNECGEFTCALCSGHYPTQDRLTKHLRQAHSMTYSCTSCGFVTKHKQVAQLHERQHDGTRYECPHCDENFKAITTYMSHLRLKHPSDFICTLCGYSFVSKKGIAGHTRVKHRFDNVQNLEGPECIPCNVRFATDAAYNVHMTVSPKHNTGPCVRNVCIETPEPKLRLHGDSITCKLCGIKVKYNLYTWHLRRAHPGRNRAKYAVSDRPHLCEQCGRSFKYKSHFDYHMALHKGDKPFQCDLCKKRFMFKGQLSLHMKRHSGNQRMYECKVCKKSFNNKGNRDRHGLIHNGKLFQCEICEKRFATLPERDVHVAHVHMKKPWPKRNRGPKGRNTADVV